MRCAIVVVGLCLLSAASADSLNCRFVGSCTTPGNAVDVVVNGTHVYVACETAGLRAISVSDPANPTEVGFCNTPGSAQGVAVSGNYAYVADGNAGFRVISIADPANPAEVGYYDTPRSACDLAVAGDYVYVAHGDAGLRIHQFYGEVGLEEGEQPTLCGSQPSPAIVRGVLRIGDRGQRTGDPTELLDAAGRKVLDLRPGPNDARHLSPGVYFVKAENAAGKLVMPR